MRFKNIYLFIFCSPLLFMACKQAYLPPEITQTNNYLVVDGILNSSGDSSIIKLTRTRNFSDTISSINENQAIVTVESEAGNKFFLPFRGNGLYSVASLPLNEAQKYKMLIKTISGETYESEYVQVKQTPEIDSLSWKQDAGVAITVNTHDPTGNTRYYRWEYIETHEYLPTFSSDLGYDYVNNVVYRRDSSNSIDRCWTTQLSPDIVLATTSNLTEDLIADYPLTFIPDNSDKISVRYSILAKQYALTKEAFEYWQQLRKNSKELGSIFGTQPQQLNSNIRCTSTPSKPVIGFVSITSLKEKRLFIKTNEVVNWHPTSSLDQFCKEIVLSPDSVRFFLNRDHEYVPAYFISVLPPVANPPLAVAKKICVDCTVRGGISKKPSYW